LELKIEKKEKGLEKIGWQRERERGHEIPGSELSNTTALFDIHSLVGRPVFGKVMNVLFVR
jgi:hypothetical protein